jgi:8-oxo-dGTP pyrophosphatase MutT (NUDIX family)
VTGPAEIVIAPVAAIEARRIAGRWDWADANRARIAAHWAGLTCANPSLYDGRVLVRRRQELRDGLLRLDYVETDFSSFIAFRDFGFPDPTAGNGFAAAALRAADGTWLLGRMGAHTANAGRIYFPSGTPDPDDVLPDGTVDLAGSVMRELAEETGLGPDDVSVTGQWTVVFAGARTAMLRDVRVPGPAEAVRDRIRAFLAGQEMPELSDIHLARTCDDIDEDAMPPFIQAFLRASFRGELPG